MEPFGLTFFINKKTTQSYLLKGGVNFLKFTNIDFADVEQIKEVISIHIYVKGHEIHKVNMVDLILKTEDANKRFFTYKNNQVILPVGANKIDVTLVTKCEAFNATLGIEPSYVAGIETLRIFLTEQQITDVIEHWKNSQLDEFRDTLVSAFCSKRKLNKSDVVVRYAKETLKMYNSDPKTANTEAHQSTQTGITVASGLLKSLDMQQQQRKK